MIDRSLFGQEHVRRQVELQVRGDRIRGRARTAEGEECERLWRRMAEIWPHYDDYQTRTDRQIPVVVVEPG